LDTLALSASTPDGVSAGWDLYLTAAGNIAVNTGGIAIAQDVGSAIRTFSRECWYDTTLGIPYYTLIFKERVSFQYIKQLMILQASIVPVPSGTTYKCFLTGGSKLRQLGGQIQIYTNGQLVAVASTGDLSGSLPWYVQSASEIAVGAST
jgi:hypothetical protein